MFEIGSLILLNSKVPLTISIGEENMDCLWCDVTIEIHKVSQSDTPSQILTRQVSEWLRI